jgi:hypothetical protein
MFVSAASGIHNGAANTSELISERLRPWLLAISARLLVLAFAFVFVISMVAFPRFTAVRDRVRAERRSVSAIL